ncbi:MAG: NAD(P)H-dependent oxidoreductase [Acidobacteria bacterium]|nr:NAD(P)H-dependent oxidoreductase [Acidobacteriota bacterium]
MAIRIVAIPGSVRPGNFTAKALDLVMDEFTKHPEVEAERIEIEALELPPPGLRPDAPGPKVLRQKVAAATGVIFATPEYHGSFSSVLKLAIENLGFPSALAGKPVALLGVAAGQIGAIKSLEHLRSVCSHVGAIVLPGPISIANVQKVFDADGDGRALDPRIEKTIRSVATNLLGYIQANICPRFALEALVRGTAE